VIGIDRSTPMLARAAKRARVYRAGRKPSRGSLSFVRGDIRALPFSDRAFAMVLAPYGILQSLLRDRDLAATLRSAARVLEPGGIFGIDLVPDVPHWREYQNRIRMRGRAAGGVHLTLIESVRQDPDRHLTIFEQCYVERRGRERTEHRFDLTFRTLPVKSMVGRLERAGFEIEAILGDYQGTPWDERADTWVVLSRIKG
jgi:SAM-dependent methyltransferase